MKKTIILILAAAILSAMLVACVDTPEAPQGTTPIGSAPTDTPADTTPGETLDPALTDGDTRPWGDVIEPQQ